MNKRALNNEWLLVILVFIVALIIRFLYFPGNVYFSFDQARDFFFASDILKGDFRIIGPPSAASTSLYAGPLSLYIYAIIQFLFGKDPAVMSVFFRIYNALGVFLIYLIGSKLFNKKVGFLASLFFAFSYEQTQYSLLMSHQPLAVLTNLIYYFGLTMLLFEKNQKGLFLALLGLGLSIQFHFVYLFLIPITLILLYVFRQKLPRISPRVIITSVAVFMLCVSSYIISELMFKFRSVEAILASPSPSNLYFQEAFYALNRFIRDAFWQNANYSLVFSIPFLLVFLYLTFKKNSNYKFIFLFLWLMGGVIPYLVSGTKGYYYSAAASVGLLIFTSFVISKIYSKIWIIGVLLVAGVLLNNILQIAVQNPKGPNLEIIIQPGMLLTQEKKVLDYIYQKADGNDFSVNALTVPLNINTTWSYLFEWYGLEKYGYTPVWAEKPAEGFPGNIKFETKRSSLPNSHFVIVEPKDGIREGDKESFFAEENYFSKVFETKDFGNIVVEQRTRI